jgi:zinc/manganese transport system substrate-binding protein
MPSAARAVRVTVAALAVVVGLATSDAAPARALRIVTSSTDLASIAKEIARDRLREAHSVFAGNQEPELWVEEVFPSWVVRSSRADAFARIGLYADVWVDTVLESAQNRRVMPGGRGHIDASEGIEVLEVPVGRIDRSLGEIHVQGNPHYLLDPLNAKIVASTVLDSLIALAPEDADYFRANARDFAARIDAAMPRWMAIADKHLRGKKLAAYHKTWSYLARRFGFVVVGYCEPKPGIEPSPADVRRLVETMVREGARLIIHAPVYSPRIPGAVAREVERRTGERVTVLQLPAHVGGVPEAPDYVGFIDYLLAQLSANLR